MIKKLTKGEEKVLNYFIKNPSSKTHVRGLSKEIGIPYATARNSLKKLQESGLLKSERKSKMIFYRPAGEKFRKAKQVTNLKNFTESGLIEFLEKNLKPKAMVLFGSYLEGQDKEDSDIDIAIIGGRDREIELSQFEEELSRSIELIYVEDAKTENKDFRNTLANGYVVQGYLELI